MRAVISLTHSRNNFFSVLLTVSAILLKCIRYKSGLFAVFPTQTSLRDHSSSPQTNMAERIHLAARASWARQTHTNKHKQSMWRCGWHLQLVIYHQTTRLKKNNIKLACSLCHGLQKIAKIISMKNEFHWNELRQRGQFSTLIWGWVMGAAA